MIGADYDVVFEKAKNDADAKKRVMGVMYTEDKSEIAWAHKSYRGVTFDYAEFCFSSGKVSSIELRKNANGYDGDAAQIIQEAYNNIETNLKSEYSSFQDTDSGLIFVGERENITVCQRELVPGDEYELNVKIEKK